MAKVAPHKTSAAQEKAWNESLRQILTSIDDQSVLIEFIFRLLTPSERIMCARRVKIVTMLMQGCTFLTIQKKLHVGQRTVESVDRWLSEFREYRTMFPKLLEQKRNNAVMPPLFRSLRRRYPLHFLLFNLLLP